MKQEKIHAKTPRRKGSQRTPCVNANGADPDARPLTRADLGRNEAHSPGEDHSQGFGADAGRVRGPLPDSPRDASGLGTGRTEPDQPARAHLSIIARDPARVFRLLKSTPP